MKHNDEHAYKEKKKKYNYQVLWSWDSYLTEGIRKLKRNDVESYISQKEEGSYFNYNLILKYPKDGLYVFVYKKNNHTNIIECEFSGNENNMILESYALLGYKKNSRSQN